LAMLLPITSRRRALAFIPDRPVYIALVDAMEFLPYRSHIGCARQLH
jgi:hypothetical protein